MPEESIVFEEPPPAIEHAWWNSRGIYFSPEEFSAIRRQGFVAREARGNSVIFKLRFRLCGKQRVKYLGRYEELAVAVQRELNELQKGRVRMRRLGELVRLARRRLKDSKRQLEPMLAEAGWKFHGRSLRRMQERCARSKFGQS